MRFIDACTFLFGLFAMAEAVLLAIFGRQFSPTPSNYYLSIAVPAAVGVLFVFMSVSEWIDRRRFEKGTGIYSKHKGATMTSKITKVEVPVDPYAVAGPTLIIEAELPDGYYRVWTGVVKPGDLVLNMNAARNCLAQWEPFKDEKIPDVNLDWAWHQVKVWGAIARRGDPVDQPCERCEVKAREPRNRFCEKCCHEVLAEAGLVRR